MGRDQPVDRRENQAERPNIKTALNRMLVRAGMNARAKIGEVAQSVADACSQQQPPVVQPYERGRGSSKFSDLPAHAGIVKHREFGRLFNIQDPFYRSHDARTGSETWMEGRRYVNFASYDYLGLSQHPAVAEAAKAGLRTADLRTVSWANFAALVLTPGVPLTHPAPHWSVLMAREAGIDVIGDFELY